jgi:hypothetical protein
MDLQGSGAFTGHGDSQDPAEDDDVEDDNTIAKARPRRGGARAGAGPSGAGPGARGGDDNASNAPEKGKRHNWVTTEMGIAVAVGRNT